MYTAISIRGGPEFPPPPPTKATSVSPKVDKVQKDGDNADTFPVMDILSPVDSSNVDNVEGKNEVTVVRNTEPAPACSGPGPTSVDPAPNDDEASTPPFLQGNHGVLDQRAYFLLSHVLSLVHPPQLAPTRKYAIFPYYG